MIAKTIGIAVIGLTLLAATPGFAGDTATAPLQLAGLEAPVTTPVAPPQTPVRSIRAPVANGAYVCSPSGFGRTAKCTTRVSSRKPAGLEISAR